MFDIGARALGAAPSAAFSEAPEIYHPASFLPNARSVIVVGVHYPDACVDFCGKDDLQEMKAYGIAQVDMNILLDKLSFRIAKFLDDRDFASLSFSTSHIWRYRPFNGTDRCFTPDFCHRHAAVAAGLGEFGWNGLVISKDYGPRIRFNSIITEAEIEPTPMYEGPVLCDKCMKCVKHCPMDTFRKEVTEMDVVRIGGKEWKFPHTNKWRCAWAEHFALGHDTEKPEIINEKSVLEAKYKFGVYGGAIGNCLRQCMPPHLREESDITNVMRRKKPEKSGEEKFLSAVDSKVLKDVEYMACIPFDELPRDIVIDEMDEGRSLILIGISVPGIMDKEIVHKMGRISESLEDTEIFLKENVTRRLGLLSLEISMIAEEHGYDAMPRIDAPNERIAAYSGIGSYSGDGRIFRTPEFGTSQMFASIVTTVPLGKRVKKNIHKSGVRPCRKSMEDFTESRGVNLFGVTPIDRLMNFDSVKKIKELYPDSRNVIVLGMHYPDAYLKGSGSASMGALGPYSFSQYQVHRELGFTALELCRDLNRNGLSGIPSLDLCGTGSKVLNVRGTPPLDTSFDRGMIGLLPYAFIPDMRCNRFAAAAAGLGTIGYNGSLLSAKYGPRQRFIAIVTDMEIEADEMMEMKNQCDDCRKCISACMTNAIDSAEKDEYLVGGKKIEIPALNHMRCDWAKRFALSGKAGPVFMGSTTNIEAPETISYETINEAFKKRDHLQDHFLAIMEPCISECPA